MFKNFVKKYLKDFKSLNNNDKMSLLLVEISTFVNTIKETKTLEI